MEKGRLVWEDTSPQIKHTRRMMFFGFFAMMFVTIFPISTVLFWPEHIKEWGRPIATVTGVCAFLYGLLCLRGAVMATTVKIYSNGVQIPYVTLFEFFKKRTSFIPFMDIVNVCIDNPLDDDLKKYRKNVPPDMIHKYGICRIVTKDGLRYGIAALYVKDIKETMDNINKYLQLYREGKLS